MDAYDHMKTVRAIGDFISDDLSNWYIRRARRRFFAEGMSTDKKSAYATTYEILTGVARMMAPVAPFISDEIYTKLTGAATVHTAYYPEAKNELIDEKVEEQAAALDEKKEAFDAWADGVKEEAAEKKDEYAEQAESIREEVKEKALDDVEEIRGSIQKPDDELEQLPVTRREPSIPQYVPKTYTREIPSEPVSDDNSVYNVDDEVQPVGNGVKASVSDRSDKKSDNKVLWIILAVVAAIIVAGCCAFTLIFALMRAAIG